MTGVTYKDAGLDLTLYEESMAKLPAIMSRTQTSRVMPLAGGFAGLFKLFDGQHRYEDPVLVSGTDGVGTKLKVAAACGRYDTVGIDLVGMCVNDCLCLGAEPLFFLDYIAIPKDDPQLVAALVQGVATGCEAAGAALIGGETAILPAVYGLGDFDMAGFCVGVVEKSRILDGSAVRAGDKLIGIASSGFHSNGYSLVRKVVFDIANLRVDSYVPELQKNVGDLLLEPTRIYAKLVAALLADKSAPIHAIAHITGGGLADNVCRVIPAGLTARIDRGSWTPPPLFDWLARLGPIDIEEMYQVFNMGIGLVLSVPAKAVDQVCQTIQSQGMQSDIIGEVVG